jgi:hypothetical protein
MSKYGTDNAIKNSKILEKRVSNNINKYGTSHPMQSDEIKLKHKTTLINRYGVDNVFELWLI